MWLGGVFGGRVQEQQRRGVGRAWVRVEETAGDVDERCPRGSTATSGVSVVSVFI